MSDLTTLRAEVEALRDAIEARYGEFMFRDKDAGAHDAYAAVLDLIDKHAREGQ